MVKKNSTKTSRPVGKSHIQPNGQKKKPKAASSSPSMRTENVPGTCRVQPAVSYGTIVRDVPNAAPKTVNGITIKSGRTLVGAVSGVNSTTFTQVMLAPVHPSYALGDNLGNLCRSFDKYRYRKLRATFMTRQPTANQGEVILCFSSNVNDPGMVPENGDFLQRAVSTGSTAMGPVWASFSIDIPTDTVWRHINPLLNVDINDTILGELEVYAQFGNSASVLGYIIFDYVVEFKDPMYTPHSAIIPIAGGYGAHVNFTDSSATPTLNAAVQLTNAAFTNITNGSILKFEICVTGSTPATGTTTANAWNVALSYNSTTSVSTNALLSFNIISGVALYLVINGNNGYVYTSIEGATSGEASGQLFYQTTGSTIATWSVNYYLVRMGLATLPALQ